MEALNHRRLEQFMALNMKINKCVYLLVIRRNQQRITNGLLLFLLFLTRFPSVFECTKLLHLFSVNTQLFLIAFYVDILPIAY